MNKLVLIVLAAVIGAAIGYAGLNYIENQRIAAAQLEIMQKQQAATDAEAAKRKKMIDDFGKALAN
ncbi:hypothetical protein [Microvirga alba]|uniref:Uncharacterized protein n=1 Tax=Microvirga alba TaxID=2791025 RepID=A0A931FSH7_9HYPH|nr:hypothetical protein [Microvirga alba]MBF9235628.1 hypothetical protein [Microvirga alba]